MVHDHEHEHEHGHDHAHQPHPFQPDLEETPLTHYQVMTQAVGDLLIDKGIIGADELRAMLEAIDAKSPAAGPRLVARAWTDEAFHARMLAPVAGAAEDIGPLAHRIKVLDGDQTSTDIIEQSRTP